LTVVGGSLFFTANDGTHGYELWDPPLAAAEGTAGTAQQPGFSEPAPVLPTPVASTPAGSADALFALVGPGDALAEWPALLLAGAGFVSTEGNAFSRNQATAMPADRRDSNVPAPGPARAAWADDEVSSAARFTLGVAQAVDQLFAGPDDGLLLDEWADDL